MASLTERGIDLAKRHPRVTGGILTTILFFGGVGAVGIKVALDNGQNPFGPTGEIAPGPWISGAALPDQNPSDNEPKSKPGCKTVRDKETPVQLMARSGAQIYPGKQVVVEYTADGHGGGQGVFPAGNLEDLNKISKVIWAGDQFCPKDPVQLQFDQGNIAPNSNAQGNNECITVKPGHTIGGIIFNYPPADGISDYVTVRRIGLGSDGSTTTSPISQLGTMRADIREGDLVCP